MTAIIDYGVGNLFSLRSSLEFIGVDCEVTGDRQIIADADRIIFPGVGAFGDAARILRERELDALIKEEAAKGKPLLGICLGMQLLYEKSFEYGEHQGLGLVKGTLENIADSLQGQPLKVPQIGWNSLRLQQESPLLKYVEEGAFVYYVHSYYARVSADTAAYSEYGPVAVTGVVQSGCVFGTQFHPEKSGDTGLNILRAFAEIN